MSGNPVEVRPATPEEAPLAVSIIDAVRASQDAALDPTRLKGLETLAANIHQVGGEVWLCEVRGAAVGTSAVRPVKDGKGLWELLWVYLLPDWRGMGMGRLLAETARDFARDRGGTELEVKIPPVHADAAGFFRTLRFLGPPAPAGGEDRPLFLRRSLRAGAGNEED